MFSLEDKIIKVEYINYKIRINYLQWLHSTTNERIRQKCYDYGFVTIRDSPYSIIIEHFGRNSRIFGSFYSPHHMLETLSKEGQTHFIFISEIKHTQTVVEVSYYKVEKSVSAPFFNVLKRQDKIAKLCL